MRNAALLMASLLGSMALAGGKRATAQGPSEQFATAEAMAGNGTDWLTGCCLTDSLTHWLTPGKLVKR